MIQIKRNNLSAINIAHYNGVKLWIEQSISFYMDIFGVLANISPSFSQLTSLKGRYEIGGTSINTLVKELVKINTKITNTEVIKILKGGYDSSKFKPGFNQPIFKDLYYLLKEIKDNIEVIIKSVPDKLLELDANFRMQFPQLVKNDQFLNEVKAILLKVFNYDKFTDKIGLPTIKAKENWEAYNLTNSLSVEVCPYCNRNYIFTIYKGKGDQIGVTRPQFDHFFSKSDYPLLALSFYNLIPSCSTCNSTLKGDTKFNLTEYLHPYLNGCGADASFNYDPKNPQSAAGESNELDIFLEITPGCQFEKQISGSNDLFHLRLIYSKHADIVSEIIKKRIISNDKYLEILQNQYKHLDLSKEELYRLAFGNYFKEEDFEKRPLSKLTYDICKRLKLI